MSGCVTPPSTYQHVSAVCSPSYHPPICAFEGFLDSITAFFANAHNPYQALSREEEGELFGEVSPDEDAKVIALLHRNVTPPSIVTMSKLEVRQGVCSSGITLPTLLVPVVEPAGSQKRYHTIETNIVQHARPTQIRAPRAKAPSKISQQFPKINQKVTVPGASGSRTMLHSPLGAESSTKTSALKRKAEDSEVTSSKMQNRPKPKRTKFSTGGCEQADLVWAPLHVDKRAVQESANNSDANIIGYAPTLNSTINEIPRTVSPMPQWAVAVPSQPEYLGRPHLGPIYAEQAESSSLSGDSRWRRRNCRPWKEERRSDPIADPPRYMK